MDTADFRLSVHQLVPLAALLLCACGGGGSSPDPLSPAAVVPPPVAPEPLPDDLTDHTFVSDHFSGSQNCATCHDGLRDTSGRDLSIVVDWKPTMMANASRDPLWRAKVASEIKRNPALQDEIEATCSRCHTPMAHVEAGFATSIIALSDDGFLHPDNLLFDAAAEGVSCTLCHQVSDTASLGTDAGFSGNFDIPFAFGIERLAFGQYDNPFTTPMRNQVGFTPARGAHASTSEVCATCHNLLTTVIDPDGSVTNQSFPEQMVYTEWENSDFASLQSCQDCHMPKVAGNVTISTRPMNGLSPRADFARHSFVGGNTYMMDILSQNAGDLSNSAEGYDELIDETRAFLGGAVAVDIEDILRVGDELRFTVRLTNFSGHKFPTSYPSRRAWLHVTVADAAGTMVFESGAVDASGRIAGLDSDTDPAMYERHYHTITSDDQVQSYETIMENIDGDLTYTLIEAATYRKDNRLLPSGMDKTAAPPTIQPRGASMADVDFVGGSDQVHYQIAGLADGDHLIEVKLNYQTLAYGFAQDLFNDIDEPRVALFKDLNDNARIRFETIFSVADNFDF